MQEIYLAGGCFWGVQKFFDQFDGVAFTEVGYANGPDDQADCATAPTYEDVCASSGHAETVRVAFDSAKLPLGELLEHYFSVIDPISVNRQGNDVGVQYRTGIYYTDERQVGEIRAVCSRQEATYGQPLAVEVASLRSFFSAEAYHQKYLEKHPGGYCHIPAHMFALDGADGGCRTVSSGTA